MELVTSRLLPVPHGFSTRDGGVSTGSFASLNLGLSVGDERAHVEENLRRLAASAGVPPALMLCVSQVHGDRLLDAGARTAQAPDALTPPLGEADALACAEPGVAVGVKTADCVPILLVDPTGRQVAAVHSGWRGTQLRIVHKVARRLVETGAREQTLLAAIGPCIRACCYEVSDELAETFRSTFGPSAAVRRGARWHLDLVQVVEDTLLAAGLARGQIDTGTAECTACDARRFFSHRRDGGRTGRHVSFAVCKF